MKRTPTGSLSTRVRSMYRKCSHALLFRCSIAAVIPMLAVLPHPLPTLLTPTTAAHSRRRRCRAPAGGQVPPLEGPRVIDIGIPGFGSKPALWRRSWRDKILPALASFQPDLIVISAGEWSVWSGVGWVVGGGWGGRLCAAVRSEAAGCLTHAALPLPTLLPAPTPTPTPTTPTTLTLMLQALTPTRRTRSTSATSASPSATTNG